MPSVVPAPSVEGHEGGDCLAADAEPPIGLSLDVVREDGDWQQSDEASAAEAIAAVAAELIGTKGIAALALSNDAQVESLNAAYRGKQAPTNVLSFPAADPGATEGAIAPFLGDIIVARETLEREAVALGIPFEDHFRHLVVHGMLHLLGFDHETDAEAHVMEAHEVRILSRMGIANPYDEDDAPSTKIQAEPTKP